MCAIAHSATHDCEPKCDPKIKHTKESHILIVDYTMCLRMPEWAKMYAIAYIVESYLNAHIFQNTIQLFPTSISVDLSEPEAKSQ